jgi:ribose 1,5-bisphosphokinase
MARGGLALVVGPSGAGKDTLIRAAQTMLAGDPRFVFPRRAVTREAMVALEDHDTVEAQFFEKQRLRGAYALDWEAHGLRYGVPASIDAAMVAGRLVVVNVSRKVVARAVEKYERCFVLHVTARPEVRAARLAGRGRESAGDVASRLSRTGAEMPEGISAIEIDNSGALESGINAFVGALKSLADELEAA